MAKYERRQRPGVMLYHDDLAYLSVFDAVEVKQIICFFAEASQALAAGVEMPPMPDLNGAAAITCQNMLEKLLRDHGKYKSTCENRSNASKNTKGDLSQPKLDEVNNGTLTELNLTELSVTERNVGQLARAPTIEEIKRYCSEQGIKTDERHFFDYYSARGWANIADWKAALRSWTARDQQYGRQPQQEEPRLQRLF